MNRVPKSIQKMSQHHRREKQTEQIPGHETNFENLFYESKYAMNIFNAEGKIVESNPQTSILLGYSNQELKHLCGRDIIHPKYHKLFTKFLNEVSQKGRFNAEAIDVRKDGTSLNIEVWGTKILYKGKLHSVSVVKDRTREKLLESKLQQERTRNEQLAINLIHSLDSNARRLSSELHDNLGQTLVSIKMDLELILQDLHVRNAPLEGILLALKEKTIKAMEDVRDINRLLRPAELDSLDLVGSLRNLFAEIQKKRLLEIHFYTKGVPAELSKPKCFTLYRIAQEALTNILKHAHATRVFVHIYKRRDSIMLTIEDNGVGFEVESLTGLNNTEDTKFGLHIMKYRTLELGGSFSIESKMGKGTVVLAELPI